jgi:hypothetical protein
MVERRRPMRSTARQLAKLVPVPRGVKPRLRSLSECPHCCSRYVQASDWQARPGGRVSIALRCPECLAWMAGTFSAERARELDRVIAEGRAELRAAHRRAVRRNMQAALLAFSQALELDLIGADDFRPARRAGCRSYQA